MEALMGVVVVQKGADAAECIKSYTTELYPCMSVFQVWSFKPRQEEQHLNHSPV